MLLVEATDRLLLTFPPSLSRKAARSLEQLGVTPVLNRMVVGIDEDGVTLQAPRRIDRAGPDAHRDLGGGRDRLRPRGAGWRSSSGAETDRAGRISVDAQLGLPGPPGGARARRHGAGRRRGAARAWRPSPSSRASTPGKLIADRLAGRPDRPFKYHDKGNLATIGRGRAVADFGFLRVSGPLAWMLWLGVHIWYLIGFQNRLLVLIRWAFSFWTRGRGARLITDESGARERSTSA